jgi:DNA-binding PadR family transcriptional regulator
MTRQTQLVLRALLDSPTPKMYGLEIAKVCGLASGTLYPILARLELDGWLYSHWEKADPVAEGRPRRRYYWLTVDGVERASSLAATDPVGQFPDDGPVESESPHFAAMVGCVTAARRLGETDPAVALLARALTATVNGRPAAARVYLGALEPMLDNLPDPAPDLARAAARRTAKIRHPSGDDGHDDAGWVPPTRDEVRELLGEGVHAGFRKATSGRRYANAVHAAIELLPAEDWAAVLDFALDGLAAAGFSITRNPAKVCGDWPAPCNCDDPLVHNGH